MEEPAVGDERVGVVGDRERVGGLQVADQHVVDVVAGAAFGQTSGTGAPSAGRAPQPAQANQVGGRWSAAAAPGASGRTIMSPSRPRSGR